MGVSREAIAKRARVARWSYTEEPVRGGRQRLYLIKNLPGDIQTALGVWRVSPATDNSSSPTVLHTAKAAVLDVLRKIKKWGTS
jgi:hypothetical protein